MNVGIPAREAIVVHTDGKSPVIDIDPMYLPDLGDGVTDVFEGMTELLDGMEEMIIDSGDTLNLSLVWSDTLAPVMIRCGTCGRVIPLHDAEQTDVLDIFICNNCMD